MMTEEQREAKRERDRIYRRRIYALKRQIMEEQKAEREAARAKRLAVRPDAHGCTEDAVAREFAMMTLLGEAQHVSYRGTGFYAGRRV
jgi:hypothetical protein